MKHINATGVNDACLQSFRLLDVEGARTTSQKGDVLALNRVVTEVSNPRDRYLSLVGRNYSIYAQIAEVFWVLSGSKVIDGWLNHFLPRAPNFSDDGHTWYRAYGPMLYRNAQWQGCIDYMRANDESRQAVLSIFDPQEESAQAIENNLGSIHCKDRSCNNMMYFYNDDGKLGFHMNNRSNDVIWGAWTINLPEFTVIQEITAAILGMELGTYSVWHNNMHVYLQTEVAVKQFYSVLESGAVRDPNGKFPDFDHMNFMGDSKIDVGTIQSVSEIRNLFIELITVLSADYDENTGHWQSSLISVIDKYGIKHGSKLHQYSLLLGCKLHGDKINLGMFDRDFATAVAVNHFTKPDMLA